MALKSGTKVTTAAPTIADTGAIAAVSGKKFRYTVDGSDPRWAKTAVLAASKSATATGVKEKIAAVVIDDAFGYMSDIAGPTEVTGA